MADLRKVEHYFKAEHAELLRNVGKTLAGRRHSRHLERLKVSLLLLNLADKIDNEFEAPAVKSNVVRLRPNQPEPPEAA